VNTAHKRDRHGFRGVPPPATFSLAPLPDDALLTEYEVAQIGRWSTNTVQSWRQQQRGHPLRWVVIPGGRIRYTAGELKAFLAGGAPRQRKCRPPPLTKSDAEPASRRATADDVSREEM
jgi:hypothetical protein